MRIADLTHFVISLEMVTPFFIIQFVTHHDLSNPESENLLPNDQQSRKSRDYFYRTLLYKVSFQ
uniref:Uncharacterized protein n=1 Tax=Rhizophagus irregularis (strain DAOM 181602 / DAOM 197198 / MUCL 43194) TaxID=747089 RepID=U9T931_RHIID